MLMTVKEAAAEMGTSLANVYAAIKRHDLKIQEEVVESVFIIKRNVLVKKIDIVELKRALGRSIKKN